MVTLEPPIGDGRSLLLVLADLHRSERHKVRSGGRRSGGYAVPESATLNEVFAASLVMATFPVALPAAVGANFTEKLALWPAPIVAGMLMPLMENPVPVTAAWMTVTLADPYSSKQLCCSEFNC